MYSLKLHLVAATACVLLLAGCEKKKPAAAAGGPPPVPVTVAQASAESVPVEVHAVGTVEPYVTVQVKSQIAGQLQQVHFTEGTNVRRGDLLFTVDPRPYQQALRQAEAVLERDTAQLRQAQAALARDTAQSKQATEDAGRYEKLMKEGVIAKMQYDQTRTNSDALLESVKADKATAESMKAALDSDRAAVAKAKLDLSYCEIRSPASGRAGNLLVQAGNLVKDNDTTLVVINQIQPIFVSFSVPAENLAAIRRNQATRRMEITVSPQDDSSKTARGVLSVIDNTVDTATGAIKLKGTFPNEQGVLWPGQFVDATLVLDTRKNATVVPSEAVQAGQHGPMIYVVKSDKTVEPRTVEVVQTSGRQAVIQKGVTAGETVVTDGQMALFPGARIIAVPGVKTEAPAL